MKVGLDVGFGHVKVATQERVFKFPSWIGVWNEKDISDVQPISFEGRDYVVGESARFCTQRVELVDFETLLRYLPLIVEYVKRELGEEELEIGVGLAPRHYRRYKDSEEVRKKLSGFELVLPQGFGVLLDVEDELGIEEGETVFIVDIGFNTVDYLLVSKQNGKYFREGMATIERAGVLQAVETFRSILPAELGYIKNWSLSRLVKVFESGQVNVEGEKIDLKSYRERAIETYRTALLSRLKSEVGEAVLESDKVVSAGGGVYLLGKLRKDAYVPSEPEFSNARGFLKALELR